MKATKKKKITKAQLERKVLELTASLASTYHFASLGINKATVTNYMGSGVLVQITKYGGEEIIPPTMIRDGLSDRTIKAIKEDMLRSWELSTVFMPEGAITH